jgi:hypothetical protein
MWSNISVYIEKRSHHGFSFFIFIFYWKDVVDKKTIINHELIHFWQQVELLFVFHWLLYITFYVAGRLNGKNHDEAYMNIPFEKEAYSFEKDYQYISHRNPFAWLQFIR